MSAVNVKFSIGGIWMLFLTQLPFTVLANESSEAGYGKSSADATANAILRYLVNKAGDMPSLKSAGTAFLLSVLENKSSGLISDWSVLESREVTPGEWMATLNVSLNDTLIRSSDMEAKIAERLARWRSVQDGLFKNRTVSVNYDLRGSENALPASSQEVIAMLDQIENELRKLQFDVVTSGSADGADTHIVATLHASAERYKKRAGMSLVQAAVRLKFIDNKNNRVIATSGGSEKDITGDSAQRVRHKISYLAGIGGEVALQGLMRDVVANYNPERAAVMVTVLNMNDDVLETLLDGLSEKNINHKLESFRGDVLEIRVLTEKSTFSIGRYFKSIAEKSGVAMKTELIEGSQLTLTLLE